MRATTLTLLGAVALCGPGCDARPTALTLADRLNLLVQRRAESCFVDVVHFPPASFEGSAGEPRQVLVELEPHELRGNRDDPLVREFGCKGKRCRDMLRPDRRILLKNRFRTLAGGEII